MLLRARKQILLSHADIESVAPSLGEIVEIIEETYRMDGRGEADVPVKIGVHPGRPHSFLHAMPAWVTGNRALGMKWISYYPGNLARGFPDSSGLIGCGGLGTWSLRVLSALFPSLSDVYMASRTQATRQKFCKDMAKEGPWNLTAVDWWRRIEKLERGTRLFDQRRDG